MGKAALTGTPLADALTETQHVVVDDMTTTGFQVAD